MLLRRRHEDDNKVKKTKVEVVEVENVTVKEPKAIPAKKPLPAKKKVTKNDKSN